METKKTLRDMYKTPGFRVRATLKPHPHDPEGYIIRLERRQKKRSVPDAVKQFQALEIGERTVSGISIPERLISTLSSSIAGSLAPDAKP